jgi:hypothetical protein
MMQAKQIPATLVAYADSPDPNNIKNLIANKEIDLVVNLPTQEATEGHPEQKNNFLTRRTAVDFGVPLLTNAQLFKMFVEAIDKHKKGELEVTKV